MADKEINKNPRGFDGILEDLRETVERLESGKLSLDESLAAYEHGVGLARQGHGLLDKAEKRVELLVEPPNDDEPEQTIPLDDER